MIFTSKQINRIIQLIQDTHWMVVAKSVGIDHVPIDVLNRLKNYGFKESQIKNFPEIAFQFGMLSMFLKDVDAKKLTFKDVEKTVRSKKYLPLTSEEKYSVELVRRQAVKDITGLGNKLASDMQTILIEADQNQRKKYEKIITEEEKKGLSNRETVKQIVSRIGHKTDDWSRDLDRIVDFINHGSYDNGRAMGISRRYGDDSLVYKRVHKDACKHCKKLYLKNLNTWEPRIFKIRTLLGNGNNIGRKTDDWKPVVGATHPWCRCDLEIVPAGWVWSDKSRRFVPAKIGKRDFRRKIKTKVEIS